MRQCEVCCQLKGKKNYFNSGKWKQNVKFEKHLWDPLGCIYNFTLIVAPGSKASGSCEVFGCFRYLVVSVGGTNL